MTFVKAKGEVVVFNWTSECTRLLQNDAQPPFMPHVSMMQEDADIYGRGSINEKDSNSYKMLIQQISHSTKTFIANGVCLWNDTHIIKHNENVVLDPMLILKCILDYTHRIWFGWHTLESCHGTLCVNFKCMEWF